MRQALLDGLGWGDAKQKTFELINAEISEARVRYESLMQTTDRIEDELQKGAKKAREFAIPYIQKLRHAVGIRSLA